MPSRILSSLRQKQSSANEGRSKTFVLIMPSRILSSLRQKQSSANEGRSKTFFLIMPSRILSSLRQKQSSERREQRQTKTKFSSLAMPSRLLSSLRCFPAALSLYYSVCYYMFHFLLLWKNVVTSPLRGGVVLCNRRYSQIKVLICREL